MLKYLGLNSAGVAYDPDITVHGGLYGHSHYLMDFIPPLYLARAKNKNILSKAPGLVCVIPLIPRP